MTTVSQAPGRRGLLTETWLVLGVSLGASAIWSILRIIERLTREVALGQQTSALNSSVTPDRPWLDLAYQLVGVALGVIPAFLALHLLTTRPGPGAHGEPAAYRIVGFDLRKPVQDLLRGAGLATVIGVRKPVQDLLRGAGLATVIGVPGLGLYAAAKAIGLNTTVAAANLSGAWWTIPVLILAAAQNAVLEEVVMVAYLFDRWAQAGWTQWTVIVVSALIRGSYHLYQGFARASGGSSAMPSWA